MVDYNNQRPRLDTGKSMYSLSSAGTEDVDLDELNDRMQSFSQDLLELQAHKTNLASFKLVSATPSILYCAAIAV